MEEQENYSANLFGMDYSLEHHHHHQDQLMEQPQIGENCADHSNGMIDYMLNNPQQQQQQQQQQHISSSSGFCNTHPPNTCFDAHFHGEDDVQFQNKNPIPESKNKRKRPRTLKTNEEVESQRMTHIAIERNRRIQMNEHLKVLRSLMPGSYVQRGDQASIVGGAIEFVRELEQLLQCLESQKTRRLHGDHQGSSMVIQQQQQQQQPLFPLPMSLSEDRIEVLEYDDNNGVLVHAETAESKSSFADVEVKLLGFDAMIKIMSKTRPGQLVKTIAALQDLNLNLLHINITTVEQTVLYSFNVKVASESRFSAEDIASSIQQIFSFINSDNNSI